MKRDGPPVSRSPRSTGRKGRGTKLGPRRRRNRLCGYVCLLCCDPALLHRETRDVARSEHVGHAVNSTVGVDRDEPVHGLRQPVDWSPLKSWERDDTIDRETIVRDELELSGNEPSGTSTCSQDDPVLVEQLMRGRYRGRAEELERFGLRRDQRQLDALDAVSSNVGRRLQRKLVGGERPDSAPGNDVRNRPDVTVQDLLEQMLDQLEFSRAAERQSAGNGRKRQCPARDEQRVVGDPGVRRRESDVPPARRCRSDLRV